MSGRDEVVPLKTSSQYIPAVYWKRFQVKPGPQEELENMEPDTIWERIR